MGQIKRKPCKTSRVNKPGKPRALWWARWMVELGVRPAPKRRPGARPARALHATVDAPPLDREALTCGWFDSSHELTRGLDVSERCDLGLGQPLLPAPANPPFGQGESGIMQA